MAAIASSTEPARTNSGSTIGRGLPSAEPLRHSFGFHRKLVETNADRIVHGGGYGRRNGNEARLRHTFRAVRPGAVAILNEDGTYFQRGVLRAGEQIIAHAGILHVPAVADDLFPQRHPESHHYSAL